MAEMGYEVTWALKATTGDQPNVNIDGVSVIETNVYPNPTTGMVTIEAENLQQVSIMDIAGRTVMTSTESVIDMSSLANGVYMFRISTANGTTTQKVVKR